MTDKYKPYPAYKPSFIECLGSIPEHWQVNRLKYLLSSLESGMRETGGGNQLDKGVFSIGGEHISWGGKLLLDTPKYISYEYFQKLNSGTIKPADVLLVKDGATIGKAALIKELPFDDCAVNEHVFILRNKEEVDPGFLYFLIISSPGQSQILNLINGSAQPGLNSAFTGLTFFGIPPLAEQQAIAAFLDYQITKIDTLIAKMERLEKLLHEKRTTFISQAVTKGIDPSVPMKESGIEWIGEIPEHWNIKKLKFLVKKSQDKIVQKPSDIPYIGLENIESWSGKINLEIQQDLVESNVSVFKPNDILFGKLRPYLAKGFIADFNGVCTTELLVLTPEPLIEPQLLLFILLSKGFIDNVNSSTFGTKMPRANWYQVGNYFIPFLSITEQNQIINCINYDNEYYESRLLGIYKLLISIKEYKTSIISKLVTGKIDVRDNHE